MKYPLRIFGEVKGLDPDRLAGLDQGRLSPFEEREDRLEVEYEGPYLDIEPVLDRIASALGERGKGWVDYLDRDEWVMLRYELKPGTWSCTRINPNNALERYHQE
jgi:hypothetical protein